MKTMATTRLWRILTFTFLISVAAVSPMPVTPAQADWKDKLKGLSDKAKEKTDEVKEKWKEREHRCSECGKIIHVGTKCASCQVQAAGKAWEQTKPKIKAATDAAKEQWRETAPKLRDAARTVGDKAKEYAPRVREMAENAGDNLRRYGPKLKEAAVAAKDRWETLKPNVREARERAADWYDRHKGVLATKAREAVDKYGSAISRTIQDPENRRKAFETLGTVLELRRQFKEAQREGTYWALRQVSELPIPTGSGTSTLGELAKERLVKRFPGLEGTDIVEDPAAPLTALLTSDQKYFLTECKLVKSGREHITITEAIGRSSSFDTHKAMKCLELMEAAESISNAVTTGEGSLDAVDKAMGVMGTLGR